MVSFINYVINITLKISGRIYAKRNLLRVIKLNNISLTIGVANIH